MTSEQPKPTGRRARTRQAERTAQADQGERPEPAGQAEPIGQVERVGEPELAGLSEPIGPAGQPGSAEPAGQAGPARRPPADPMKGFRGVMAGTLVLEAIVVALSLLVVAKLYGGLGTSAGALVGVVIVVLLITCGLLRHPWSLGVIAAAQLALICCFFLGSPGVGAVGVLFALIWCYLLWLRWDVARRMAAGRLPSQQAAEPNTE
jgi:hypothetical protein